MSVWRTLTLVIAFAATCVASSAAEPSDARYFVTQYDISTRLEARGFPYEARHVDVDTAICIGLRPYGVRRTESGARTFWRFSCDIVGANDHYYTVRVSTTLGADGNHWYWHILSTRRDY
jgi:hypothetical protein